MNLSFTNAGWCLAMMKKNPESNSHLNLVVFGLGLATLPTILGFGSGTTVQAGSDGYQLTALSSNLNAKVKQPVSQKSFKMVFDYIVKRADEGLLNKNTPRITLEQSTPCGYVNDIFPEGRDFPQQLVKQVSFNVNGKEIPFLKDPTLQDTNYWTIRKNPYETRDISQVRIILDAPASKEMVVRAQYTGVWAQQLAVDTVRQGEMSPALPQQEITEEQLTRYKRLSEPAMNLRPDEFKSLMEQKNLFWDKSKETEVQFITRIAKFIATFPREDNFVQTDMQKLLRDGGTLQCNSESMLATSILRMNGIPTRMTSGWVLSGKAGHAITQVYSESLNQWLDFGGITPVGVQSPTLRFDISYDRYLGNGSDYSLGVSSSGLMKCYEMNAEGRGPRFLMYTGIQFDAANSKVTDLKEGDPGWMDATPRKYTGDVLVQGEKMEASTSPASSGKFVVDDGFFHLNEGRMGVWVRPEVGSQLTLKASKIRPGDYRVTAMLCHAADYGQFQITLGDQPSKAFDFYSQNLEWKLVELSPKFTVKSDGSVTLSAICLSANPKMVKGDNFNMIGIDYLRFEPVKN
jgi:hypothetical protein